MMYDDEFGYSRFKQIGYLVGLFTFVIFMFGIMVLSILYLPQALEEKIEKDIEKLNLEEQQRNLIKQTTDCKTLQSNILDLISSGKNPDSWFPTYSEKTLKIAKERYAILC